MFINVNKTKIVVFLEDPLTRKARHWFNFTLTPAFPIALPETTRIQIRQEVCLRKHTPSARPPRPLDPRPRMPPPQSAAEPNLTMPFGYFPSIEIRWCAYAATPPGVSEFASLQVVRSETLA